MEYTITYEGSLRTKAQHSGNQKVLLTDVPVDNQGKGEEFSPTDLIAVGLGSCVLTLMGIEAKRLGVDLEGAKASVTKEMTAKPVRRLHRVEVLVESPPLEDEDLRKKLEQAGLGCPVHHSLHPDVIQEISFVWGKE